MKAGSLTAKGSEKGRYEFRHKGELVYEWEQTLEEVNLYVRPPEGVTSDMIECRISPSRVTLGLCGNPPFLDEKTFGPVVADESYWTLADGELTIFLQKVRKAETWEAALVGRGTVDPFTKQEIQKEMMLERFQEENPGFDFRGAEFNGAVPDPREFMDGVKYR
ncbi:hypothetical protein CTAYLR_006266 [Chrysophaeum taylorii]|uniref:CS domain-containing protein n=1 Tax=Chrysophaeum taylorii TaxID=2483200 RepID=A0AAD7UJS0_9STRA|nr:hypothetical protein CTAYLR_006266 [Chrysophaeum taylorii]